MRAAWLLICILYLLIKVRFIQKLRNSSTNPSFRLLRRLLSWTRRVTRRRNSIAVQELVDAFQPNGNATTYRIARTERTNWDARTLITARPTFCSAKVDFALTSNSSATVKMTVKMALMKCIVNTMFEPNSKKVSSLHCRTLSSVTTFRNAILHVCAASLVNVFKPNLSAMDTRTVGVETTRSTAREFVSKFHQWRPNTSQILLFSLMTNTT